MAEPIPAPMIESTTAKQRQEEAIMRWLASNWIFILFVVGMVWMHRGHGGHGGHGSRRQQGRPEDRDEHGSRHGGHGEPTKPDPTPGHGPHRNQSQRATVARAWCTAHNCPHRTRAVHGTSGAVRVLLGGAQEHTK